MLISLSKGILVGVVAGQFVKWVLERPLYTHVGYIHNSAMNAVGSAVVHHHRKVPETNHIELFRLAQ